MASVHVLQVLKLSYNLVNGSLPVAWAQRQILPALLELHMSSTRLSGSLPDEWGGGSGLHQLQVGTCLRSCMPWWFAACCRAADAGRMQALNLSHNALTGKLPAVWGSSTAWPALQSLSLSGCQLRGTLVKQWGIQNGFTQLGTLQLDNNQLSGTLPAEWATDPAFPDLQVSLRPLKMRLCMHNSAGPTAGLSTASRASDSSSRACAEPDSGLKPPERQLARLLGFHSGLELTGHPGSLQQLVQRHPAHHLGKHRCAAGLQAALAQTCECHPVLMAPSSHPHRRQHGLDLSADQTGACRSISSAAAAVVGVQ